MIYELEMPFQYSLPPNVGRKLDDINTEEVVNLLGTFTAGLIQLRFLTCHGLKFRTLVITV